MGQTLSGLGGRYVRKAGGGLIQRLASSETFPITGLAGDGNGTIVATSTSLSQDILVTTYVREGYTMLISDDSDNPGKKAGWALRWQVSASNPDGRASLWKFSNFPTGGSAVDGSGSWTGIWGKPAAGEPATAGLVTTFGVNPANAATDTFTFGRRGVDLVLEYNGVSLVDLAIARGFSAEADKLRFALKQGAWRHMERTVAAFAPTNGHTFLRNALIAYPATTLLGNYATRNFDLRDFGLKELNTTGSMTVGSNTLTVASAGTGRNAIAVGDTIIVEPGRTTLNVTPVPGNVGNAEINPRQVAHFPTPGTFQAYRSNAGAPAVGRGIPARR